MAQNVAVSARRDCSFASDMTMATVVATATNRNPILGSTVEDLQAGLVRSWQERASTEANTGVFLPF
ncbi:uncharacterized protein PITG_17458 [Phytophthora infestans T30-4]|uniref:Uncharacterized protein n=1 Tax=Phytophthora infestans (strain T30-4) TaxID=403677 RepID=D0NW39_PHYIT|nr:uncharacterized protein PITG_17458 [Phytophthora infestans T30-4]EEY66881.1 hypothetical protein PITG_17458 [Phytophthora infestans T30-4]|eukprot:XP_002896690.1 hypothetical protein PITG_17458 [Phytophthora infestans T30-4]